MWGLLIAAIVAATAGIVTSVVQNSANTRNVRETNEANKQMQEEVNQTNAENVASTNATNLQIARENNEQEMDLAKNGVTYRMQDLQNAGLNPVMAASGFGGSPQATLSTPSQQAAQAQASRNQAPMVDFSGMSSAVNAINSMMLTKYMMDQRQSIAAGYQQVSRDNNAARNEVLNNLYQRKAASFESNAKHIHSSKQIHDALPDNGEWEKMLKELDSFGYKYNWKK